MQILYDGQIYAMQAAGGINRYFGNIISRLSENDIPTLTTIERDYKLNYPIHSQMNVYSYKRFRPAWLSRKLEKCYFRYCTNYNNFDVAHPTYYSLLTYKEVKEYSCPVVVTIYDMIHELFANEIEPEGHTIEAKRKAILAAQAIICISENTKKDLLQLYPTVEDKISVTYLASEIDASLAFGSEAVPSKPYYLYIGSRTSCYKNFDGLLIAFSKAISVNPDIYLCVVGASFNDIELKLINELKLADHIKHYGYASDSHIAKLYRCSIAFIYPSLYEGFGIPPLEAMACGTVVVAANSSSIPEVVSDAGILFNPKAKEDLADILLSLIDNPQERDRLIHKGQQRVKEFSWDKTAEQTFEVYRSISD